MDLDPWNSNFCFRILTSSKWLDLISKKGMVPASALSSLCPLRWMLGCAAHGTEHSLIQLSGGLPTEGLTVFLPLHFPTSMIKSLLWDWGGGRPRRLTFFLLQTGGGWRRRGRVCPWKAGMMCSVTHQCCYEELSSSPDLILLKPCQIAMVWKESTQNCMPNLTGILRFPSILKNLKWTFYKMPQLNYL